MGHNQLVSLITPTYNHEKCIARCIESVIMQTYSNWEQIIIDDGSIDRTGEVARKFKDERIHYIWQENVGVWRLADTYNRALKLSKGELVAILEGDDFIPPWKLETEIPLFANREVVLTFGKAITISINGRTLGVTPEDCQRYVGMSRNQMLRELLLGCFIPSATVMCRREALEKIGGFQQPKHAYYADYPTWLELSLLGQFQFIDKVLGYWGQHDDNCSIRFAEMDQSYRCAIDFFKRQHNELSSLTGFTLERLLFARQQQLDNNNFHFGRQALCRHDWQKAENKFIQSFRRGTFTTKFKAFLGILCARLKINIEISWAISILELMSQMVRDRGK
jgi:glycosyltransferase involved in cell wall biosynthesis